ncbi:MAG: FAD-dependent oxidoreductase [Methylocystis sp.]
MHIDALDSAGVAALEPDLAPIMGGIHYRDTAAIMNPGALSQAYADLFVSRGGVLVAGDARNLSQEPDRRWRVEAADGPVSAGAAVAALGPWSDAVCGPLGYRIPLGWKRGYHMHYAARMAQGSIIQSSMPMSAICSRRCAVESG